MKKIMRKSLITILLTFVLLFAGLSVVMFNMNTANAETALTVTEAKQTLLDIFGGGTLRSEYDITFNKDIFGADVADGAIVSSTNEKKPVTQAVAEFDAFLNQVDVNGATKLGAIQGGCSLSKVSGNTVKVITGIALGYAEIKIPAGITLNGNTTSATNLYQQRDGSFSTTPYENFEVFSAFERPQGNTSVIWLDVWCTESIGGYNWDSLNNILVNGNKIGAIKAGQGVHDSKGENNYAFRIDLNITELNKLDGDKILLTFPKGFDISKNRATVNEFTFVGSKSADRAWRDLMPVWYEESVLLNLTSAKQTNIDVYANLFSEYTFTFDKDVLKDNVPVDSIVASTIEKMPVTYKVDYFDNFLKKVSVNGTKLAEIADSTGSVIKGSAIKKVSNNSFKVIVKSVLGYAKFNIPEGIRLGGLITENTNLYLQRDGSFSTKPYENIEVFSVFERPLNSDTLMWLDVWFTDGLRSGPAYVDGYATKILVNGKPIGSMFAGKGEMWDRGENEYGFHLRIKKTEVNSLANDKIVLTFPKGFMPANKATVKDATFIGSKSADRGWRAIMPVWEYADLETGTQTSSETNGKYAVRFVGLTDTVVKDAIIENQENTFGFTIKLSGDGVNATTSRTFTCQYLMHEIAGSDYIVSSEKGVNGMEYFALTIFNIPVGYNSAEYSVWMVVNGQRIEKNVGAVAIAPANV